MAKIKLGLERSDVEVIQLAINVHTGLTGNANVPTPSPTLVVLQTDITAATDAVNAYEAAKDAAKTKRAARDAAMLALRNALRAEAATVEVATGGDEQKILSTGFQVRAHPTPVAIPDTVTNLQVRPANIAGALVADWNTDPRAQFYEVQVSTVTPTESSWVTRCSITRSRTELNSFTSGSRVWTRVRALNSAGAGGWSVAVDKIVP